MKNLLVISTVLTLAGCASSEAARKAAAAPLPWCDPCTQPCTPPCGPVAVATPAPAPKSQPLPAEPAAAARLSPAPGTYEAAQLVTAKSDTAGAVIHCTTDGSTPTASSPKYQGPISVDRTTEVRCIAIAPGKPESTVSGGEYRIQPPKKVVVTEKKLELTEKVYFDTGKATIKPASFPLLDEVAQTLKDHGEVKKVRIEGHTDSTGSTKVNTALSRKRAQAVRAYLVEKGVEATRLDAKGFGPSKPVADNKTAEGREKNRRVEFMITSH